jgi:hypothetical protein
MCHRGTARIHMALVAPILIADSVLRIGYRVRVLDH